MELEKDTVCEHLRANGDHDRAHEAANALPHTVDTERDAGLLHRFDVNVSELAPEGGSPEG